MTSRNSALQLEEVSSGDAAVTEPYDASDATENGDTEEPEIEIGAIQSHGKLDLLGRNQYRSQDLIVDVDHNPNCNISSNTAVDDGCHGSLSTIDSSESQDLLYGPESIIDLFVPISICMTAVVITINSVTFFTEGDVYLIYTPFHEETDDPIVKIGESIANALILLSIIICSTLVLLCLFVYEYYKVLQVWMFFATFLMLFFFAFLYLHEVLKAYNVPMDYITTVLFVWNFGAIGIMSIHWKGPLLVQQMYMITISALISLMFIKHLPDWTTWSVLAIVAIWDVVAVLSPYGPLRKLVETAQDRDKQLFPALIYSSTILWNITMADLQPDLVGTRPHPVLVVPAITGVPAITVQTPTQPLDRGLIEYNKLQKRRSDSYKKEDGVMLGLGDFIFYSMLVGKASSQGDWNTTLACFVAILIGLAITLLLLIVVKKALPALPISISFGIIFYFCTSMFVKPFMENCAFTQVFI